MTTIRKLVLRFVFLCVWLLAAPAFARADEPPPAAPAAGNPLGVANLDKYKVNPDKGDVPLVVGRRFLDDLKAASPDTWASVTEAVRFEIQRDETSKFAHQKSFVIYAYGAIWVILIVFVIGVYSRQRKLAAELAELERRVSVEKK